MYRYIALVGDRIYFAEQINTLASEHTQLFKCIHALRTNERKNPVGTYIPRVDIVGPCIIEHIEDEVTSAT